jgi:hypothetical protein
MVKAMVKAMDESDTASDDVSDDERWTGSRHGAPRYTYIKR